MTVLLLFDKTSSTKPNSLFATVNSSFPLPLARARRWSVGPLPLRVFTLIRDSFSLPRPPIRNSVFTLIR
ncbi:hypothetical protein AHAS_Ahas12G0143400 [Arachis hypogaea]